MVWAGEVESKWLPQPFVLFLREFLTVERYFFTEVKQAGNKTYVSYIFLLFLIYYSLRRQLIFNSGVETEVLCSVLYFGVITCTLQTQRSKADIIFLLPVKQSYCK